LECRAGDGNERNQGEGNNLHAGQTNGKGPRLSRDNFWAFHIPFVGWCTSRWSRTRSLVRKEKENRVSPQKNAGSGILFLASVLIIARMKEFPPNNSHASPRNLPHGAACPAQCTGCANVCINDATLCICAYSSIAFGFR